MKKSIYLVGISLAAVLFSGCASAPVAVPTKHYTAQIPDYLIEIDNGMGSPSWAASEKEAFLSVLQASAETTIDQGFDYFAIAGPASISNRNGVMINTADELAKKCIPQAYKALDFGGLHKCGVYATKAVWRIQLFHKRPNDFFTYKASDVIKYLKRKGFYKDDQKVKIIKK